MARAGRTRASSKSGAIRFQRQRRDDLISDLSDDVLLLILRRVDTRTALGAGSISRRWARLPRELPALDFRVSDLLPPRHLRWLLLHLDMFSKPAHLLLQYRSDVVNLEIMPNIERYKRRAMRAFNSSIERFLEGPRRRRGVVKRLSLEFFVTGNGCSINRLIEEAIDAWGVEDLEAIDAWGVEDLEAIDAWGVEDLEAIAQPLYHYHNQKQRDVVHAFPSHGLCKEPRASRLRTLKLGRCALPPLHEYGALTMLVLRDISSTTPAAYEAVFTSCPKLQTLHLILCRCQSTDSGTLLPLVVDAPSSDIRELVVDNCSFRWMELRTLPCLESLASRGVGAGSRVLFEHASFPSLRRSNFAMHLGMELELEYVRQYFALPLKMELHMFLRWTPNVTSLVVRFTGPDRWIVPSTSSPLLYLPSLRRLLVADVPASWDASWPRLFLEVSPSLEILHVNIASCGKKPAEEISWQPSSFGSIT